MNTKWIIPALFIPSVLLSCGGGETTEEGSTDSTSTAETVVEESTLPVEKNYDYFSKKLDNIQLEGLTLTKDLVNDNADYGDIRRSWLVDPAKDGCDKLQINTMDLSKASPRADNDYTSLDHFQEVTTRNLSAGVTCSEFKEYTKDDSLHFYYCTLKGCKETFGKQNFNQIYFRHSTGNIGVTGWVSVYDNTKDLAQAEQVALKMMDYIAKP